jgi:predicted TPR repeat methyltransferase
MPVVRYPPIEELRAATRLLWEWLWRLDEVERARDLLHVLPYVLDDDDTRKQLLALVTSALSHCESPEAYAAAYDSIWEGDTPQTREQIIATAERVPRYVWALQWCQQTGATSFLDLGCGSGVLPLYLALHGIHATGVNLTSRCVQPAIEVATRLGIPADFIYGHSESIEQSADIVGAFEILEHVRDPGALVAAMTRNARKLCLLTTPNGSTTFGTDIWGQNQHDPLTDYGPQIAHIRVYTPARLTAVLAGQGEGQVQVQGNLLMALWVPAGAGASGV